MKYFEYCLTTLGSFSWYAIATVGVKVCTYALSMGLFNCLKLTLVLVVHFLN